MPRKPSKVADFKPADFTAEGVKALLEKELKGDILPSDLALDHFTRLLNQVLLLHKLDTGVWSQEKERTQSAKQALDTLTEYMDWRFSEAVRRPVPVLTNENAEFFRKIDKSYKLFKGREEAAQTNFDSFVRALSKADASPSGEIWTVAPQQNDWTQIAQHIAGPLKRILKEANPRKRYGNSNGGPMARIVAALIPLITGQKPETETVAKRLMKGRSA